MAAKAAARIRFIREIRGSNSLHAGERIFASLPQMAADGEGISTRMKRNGTRMEANPLLRIRFIRVIRGSKSFRRGDVLMGKEFQRE